MSEQLILTPEERDFILAFRGRMAKLDDLHQQAEQEEHEWVSTHEDDEPYVALNMPDSKGAAAYAECVEVMAGAAVDAFKLAARTVGASGWQASVAELQFLKETRGIKGPFGIYQMEDALYPQYDVVGRINKMRWSDDTVKWLGDCAEYALAEGRPAADSVIKHWQELVIQRDMRSVDS